MNWALGGKQCSQCAERVNPVARVCKWCGHTFTEVENATYQKAAREDDELRTVLARDHGHGGRRYGTVIILLLIILTILISVAVRLPT